MKTISWEPDNKVRWHKVEDATPRYDARENALGTQVLIWPPHEQDGCSPAPVAFYGKRITSKPSFYLHGAVIYPTHWAHLPAGPKVRK